MYMTNNDIRRRIDLISPFKNNRTLLNFPFDLPMHHGVYNTIYIART